ncbi:MAG: amidase [Gemmatimonadota bacterium]|nr:amidase [Gemmatimonadota bacterium]
MSIDHDRLDALEPRIAAMAERLEAESGIDRRHFMLYSLAAAAASTFGASAARAMGAPVPDPLVADDPSFTPPQAPAQGTPPLPLGNGEAPALQFQAYPGGTGALLDTLLRERGAAAFARTAFTVRPFKGAVPASDEDIAFLPAHRQAALIKARKLTSVRLTDIYLERLKRLNPTLNCVVTLMEASAREEARGADQEIAAGKYRGPLHGLPYGLKDLFSTRGGVPTTWGASDFKDRVIDEDAEIVVRLRNAGAVLVAKLSTGLFAQNDQWFGGRTNNPWNLSIGSSGSSAGPASATAAGCVAFAIGTETQGSIVSPAIRCGLSALRPTFGRTTRHGGMVLAWSQDRVGPLCRTAEDCAMVFNAYHGVDDKDPSTITTPFHFDRALKLSTLRIGVDPAAPKELVDTLKSLGVKPREIGARPTVAGVGQGSLNVEYAAAFDAYVQRKAKEIGLDLNALPAPIPGRAPAPFGNAPASTSPMAPADWNPRFVAGRAVRAFEYVQNQRRRLALVQAWGVFMRDLDCFIGAPTADVAPNAQTGHPCVVVPYKFDVPQFGFPGQRADTTRARPTLSPQPIGGVITGALFHDDVLLSVAHQIQEATTVHLKRPAL